ncbi:MAG: YncE family protein [Lautropia sp.]
MKRRMGVDMDKIGRRRVLGTVGSVAVAAIGTATLARGARAQPAGAAVSAGAAAPAGATPLPRIVVLNSRDASVSLIEQSTCVEVGRIDVGKEPHHLYPTPDNAQLIVASAASDELHFLDPVDGRVLSRLRGVDDPYQLAFSPDQRWFVTAALRLDRVDVYGYDGKQKQLLARIPLPKMPSHLWFAADSRHCFVTLQGSDEIAAIDAVDRKLLWKMPVGKQPAGILLSPDEKHLFVGIMGEDYVQVIDWREQRTVARIRTGAGAHNFRGLGDGRHLLVTNRVADTVSRIDMTELTVLDSIRVPGGPDCMDLAADGRMLWVTSRWTKRVTLVDLAQRRVVRAVPVGRSPHGVYLHNRAALV